MKDLWNGMKMPTRIAVIGGFVTVVMALIYTGQLGMVLAWIASLG